MPQGGSPLLLKERVGYVHGVKPGNVVGAIANVAGLEGRQIVHVDIREDHTFVGLRVPHIPRHAGIHRD